MAGFCKADYVKMPEGISTKRFLLGEDALLRLSEFFRQEFPGKTPWIVADDNTWRVAGEKAFQLFQNDGLNPAEPFVYPGTPRLHPVYAEALLLAKRMPENAIPVAVGSGVINDIVKCVGGANNVPYLCVPTACSVDGYTSAGAAMTVDGFKMTVPCPAPRAICADTGILVTAPGEMFAAGYADLLAKVPAGSDWIIADQLGQTPIRPEIWELIQVPLRDQVTHPDDMQRIFAGLANTGYGMQMMNDSRPASGAEHLMSHVWEMEGLQYRGEDVSHGFKVGIGTLACTLLHEYIAEHPWDSVAGNVLPPQTVEEREQEVDELLKLNCYGDNAKKTAMSKFLTGDELAARRKEIAEKWETIRRKIREQNLPYNELCDLMKKASCPTTPEEIGLSREQFIHAIFTAQLIRIRYTALDLLQEAGLLAEAVEYVKRHML